MALFRCSSGGGTGWTFKGSMNGDDVTTQNFTISGLTVGKTYHIFSCCASATSSGSITNSTISAVSGASNLQTVRSVWGRPTTVNMYGAIIEQTFTATDTSATLRRSASSTRTGYLLFEE